MNDSLSVSSSYSSSNNSNSNSLNRSLMANGNFSLVNSSNINNTANSSSIEQALFRNRSSRYSGCDYLQLQLQMTPIKRRSKSQIIYYGDEMHTIAEHNKQLIEDLYSIKMKININQYKHILNQCPFFEFSIRPKLNKHIRKNY